MKPAKHDAAEVLGDSSTNPPRRTRNSQSLPLAVPFILSLFLAGVLLLGHLEGRFGTPGQLEGPDSYMWLLQTEQLYHGAGWYDISSPRSNAPYGETLHWGRPFQLVLLLPALLLAGFFGFHQALFLWGVAVGPALLVPTAVLIVWALRPLLDRFQLLLACGLFLSNPAIVTDFFPAQADHRCLNTLLFTAVLGLSIRVLNPKSDEVPLWLLGLLSAVGLWSSMEMLLPICLLQATFFSLWLLRDGIWARRACRVSLATLVFAVGALLLHRPISTWPHDFEDDSLSSLQVILLALLALAWGVQWKFASAWNWMGKLALAFVSGAAILAVLYLLHPTFLHGPFGDVNPEVQRIWRDKVEDTAPLAGISLAALAVIFYLLGTALLAWPTALILPWRFRISPEPRWLYLSVGLTAAILLALFVADRCATQAALYAMDQYPFCYRVFVS